MERSWRGGDRLRVLSVLVAMGLPGQAVLAQMVSLDWVTGPYRVSVTHVSPEAAMERDCSEGYVRDRTIVIYDYRSPVVDSKPIAESGGRMNRDAIVESLGRSGLRNGNGFRPEQERRTGPGAAIGGAGLLDPQLVNGPTPKQSPAQSVQEKPTIYEQAENLVRAEKNQEAAEALATHLADSPQDAVALRLEGVALLKAGDVAEAAVRILRAYELQPTLCADPVSQAILEAGGMTVRRLRQKVTARASRGGKAYWLAAVVLLQAEGDYDGAEKMLDRATEARLDVVLGAEMATALEQQAQAERQTKDD